MHLKKRATEMILSRVNLHHNHIDQSLLQNTADSTYLYPSYVDYVWPVTPQDCSVYEALLPLFQSSYTEVQAAGTIVSPQVSSRIVDSTTGIVFNYLTFVDSAPLSTTEKTKILDNLSSSITYLNDIINNDKCNFFVQWKAHTSTYLCASTAGTIDASGNTDDKCTRL